MNKQSLSSICANLRVCIISFEESGMLKKYGMVVQTVYKIMKIGTPIGDWKSTIVRDEFLKDLIVHCDPWNSYNSNVSNINTAFKKFFRNNGVLTQKANDSLEIFFEDHGSQCENLFRISKLKVE